MPHKCHATACTALIPLTRFLCPRHWRRLPLRLRYRIWLTYMRSRPGDWQTSVAYAAAAREAVCYLAGLEGLQPDTRVWDALDRT